MSPVPRPFLAWLGALLITTICGSAGALECGGYFDSENPDDVQRCWECAYCGNAIPPDHSPATHPNAGFIDPSDAHCNPGCADVMPTEIPDCKLKGINAEPSPEIWVDDNVTLTADVEGTEDTYLSGSWRITAPGATSPFVNTPATGLSFTHSFDANKGGDYKVEWQGVCKKDGLLKFTNRTLTVKVEKVVSVTADTAKVAFGGIVTFTVLTNREPAEFTEALPTRASVTLKVTPPGGTSTTHSTIASGESRVIEICQVGPGGLGSYSYDASMTSGGVSSSATASVLVEARPTVTRNAPYKDFYEKDPNPPQTGPGPFPPPAPDNRTTWATVYLQARHPRVGERTCRPYVDYTVALVRDPNIPNPNEYNNMVGGYEVSSNLGETQQLQPVSAGLHSVGFRAEISGEGSHNLRFNFRSPTHDLWSAIYNAIDNMLNLLDQAVDADGNVIDATALATFQATYPGLPANPTQLAAMGISRDKIPSPDAWTALKVKGSATWKFDETISDKLLSYALGEASFDQPSGLSHFRLTPAPAFIPYMPTAELE